MEQRYFSSLTEQKVVQVLASICACGRVCLSVSTYFNHMSAAIFVRYATLALRNSTDSLFL